MSTSVGGGDRGVSGGDGVGGSGGVDVGGGDEQGVCGEKERLFLGADIGCWCRW